MKEKVYHIIGPDGLMYVTPSFRDAVKKHTEMRSEVNYGFSLTIETSFLEMDDKPKEKKNFVLGLASIQFSL